MPNIAEVAKRLMAANPSIANNPNNKPMLDAIINGDTKRVEEYANNILNSRGMTMEQFFKQFNL